MNTAKLPVIFLVLCSVSSNVFAGAWAQQKGHFYSKLTFIQSLSEQRFDFMKQELNFTFNDKALYFYTEYGLLNGTTLVVSMPLMKESEAYYFSFKGTTKAAFAGDIEFQLKQNLLSGPLVLSAAAGINLPVIYSTETTPPLGAGVRNYDLKLLAGTSFYPIPAYVTGDFGYRVRQGDFENEMSFSAEAGYTVMNKFLFRLLASGMRSIHIDEMQQSFSQFSFQQEQYRVGTGLIYLLNKNIEFDVTFLKTTSGRNFPEFTEIYFGIAFKR